MGTQLNTPVDFNSKTPDEWRDVTQSMFQTMVIKDYNGEETLLSDIQFDVLPSDIDNRKKVLNEIGKTLPREWGISAEQSGAILNPEAIKAFKEIDPTGKLFKSLYNLYQLQKIESGGYLPIYDVK
jgi:hypothetical protein